MKIPNELKNVEKLDHYNMRELLNNFPKMIQDADGIGENFELPASYKKKYSAVCFSGLGGSAIGADFIKSFLEDELPVPVIVNREYAVPALVGKDTLFIASSYSGNTEETLSAYRIARKRGANIIVASSDGKLMESAIKEGLPFIRVPGKLPPRLALAYATIPFIHVFSQLGLILSKENEIKETIKILEDLREDLRTESSKRNTAKRIAGILCGKFPVIYGAGCRISAVVTRWRGQLAENSKTLSSSHLLPEMNHNEIVGWEHPGKLLKQFAVILLKDRDDHPRVKLRMEITKSILKKTGAQIIEVDSTGKTLLARLFSLSYIGDWVSFYLAVINGEDPTPVDRITYLKKKLAQ